MVVSKHLRDKLVCVRMHPFLAVVCLDFYNVLTLLGIGLWSKKKIKGRHNVLTDFERV